MLESSLMKRYGTLDEQAAAITFLASEEASYITGQTLVVDGGRTNLNAQLVYGVSESGRGLRLANLTGAGSLVLGSNGAYYAFGSLFWQSHGFSGRLIGSLWALMQFLCAPLIGSFKVRVLPNGLVKSLAKSRRPTVPSLTRRVAARHGGAREQQRRRGRHAGARHSNKGVPGSSKHR